MLPATIEPDALRALEVSASPPSWGAGLAALLAVAVLAWAVRGADWARVADGSDDAPDAPGAGAHRFWGLATAVAVLWHADPAGVAGLHLLGAATACALLGLRPALVALAIGIAFRHVADGLAPQALQHQGQVEGNLHLDDHQPVLLPRDQVTILDLPAHSITLLLEKPFERRV